MARAEAGRRGQNHVIHTAVNDVLIRVEPEETAVVGNVDGIAEFFDLRIGGGDFLQGTAAAVKPILEDVAQGVDFDVGGGVEHVVGGAGAPAAATDQAHLDEIAAGRVRVADQAPIGSQ